MTYSLVARDGAQWGVAVQSNSDVVVDAHGGEAAYTGAGCTGNEAVDPVVLTALREAAP
jgi:uncharacterized Ntn-hydrolase superfamily protein